MLKPVTPRSEPAGKLRPAGGALRGDGGGDASGKQHDRRELDAAAAPFPPTLSLLAGMVAVGVFAVVEDDDPLLTTWTAHVDVSPAALEGSFGVGGVLLEGPAGPFRTG